jgi:polyhydroxyalkanoate synthesis regulator phasin
MILECHFSNSFFFSLTFLSLIKMEDLFKKFVYTGVGMVSSSLEKFQKSVEKLVDEDKLSQEEGKKLVDDLFKILSPSVKSLRPN